MAALFTYASIYRVHANCLTPMRTAGAGGDPDTVLRDPDGRPFLQGTSIAGALREWVSAHYPDSADDLFGSQENTGSLIISDGLFSEQAPVEVRPRLKINARTGAALDGHKFDVAHVAKGEIFDFTVTWLGNDPESQETVILEQTLAAINAGAVTFGAQWSNGFGRVSVTVKKQAYDMTREDDRRAWLADEFTGTEIELPVIDNGYIKFVVSGYLPNTLVKSGAPVEVTYEALSGEKSKKVTRNIMEGGEIVLPGSSVKGAIRAQSERIAEYLHTQKGISVDAAKLFGAEASEGSDGQPGSVRVDDVKLAKSESDSESKAISRIRLNKFTGSVIRQGLFTEEPFGSPVEFVLFAKKDMDGCGLLYYALRDLGLGLYGFGSGGSIGRGLISDMKLEISTPDGKSAKLIFDSDRRPKLEDPDSLVMTWLRELEVTDNGRA